MEKKNEKEYRLIQINNYVKTRKDYLKIKKAQKLSRELSEKYQREKLEKLMYNLYDEDDENICRICFEGETKENNLIRPCKCKGTQRYIHKSCLMTWIHLNIDNPEKRDYCDICKYKFKYDNESKEVEAPTNNVVININLDPYLIKQNFKRISIKNTLIIIFSMCCAGLDMNLNFFSIKLLSFGIVDNRSQIIKDFSIIHKNTYSSMRSYMYFVYLSYIICLIETQFIFFIRRYIIRFKYIKYDPYKTIYDEKISSASKSLTLSNLLFYVFFYLSLFTNQVFTMQFFIIIYLIVTINYEYYILKHNKIIKELAFNIYRDNNINLFTTEDNTQTAEIIEYKSEIGSDDSV